MGLVREDLGYDMARHVTQPFICLTNGDCQ